MQIRHGDYACMHMHTTDARLPCCVCCACTHACIPGTEMYVTLACMSCMHDMHAYMTRVRALPVFISFWAHHGPLGAFFLDLSLASPNVRWRLSRPITSENGLLGQAEDFNLLGHPAEQRGEFYKLKVVGWCAGWLRRVRRVTLLALHQLTCRRLDNEHSQSDPKMIPNTTPKVSELKC